MYLINKLKNYTSLSLPYYSPSNLPYLFQVNNLFFFDYYVTYVLYTYIKTTRFVLCVYKASGVTILHWAANKRLIPGKG